MKTTIIVAAIAALALGACSTTPNVVKEAERAEKAASKRVEQTLSRAPDWFVEPHESSSKVVFTTGSAASTNLGMSRDKAILNAQAQLADQLNALVSGMTKQYMRDTGVDTTVNVEDTEQVVRKLTAEANVAGYRIQAMEIIPEGRYFRTYVMLAYPIGETNTIRQQQEHAKMLRNLPEQKAKAYDELDNLIEKVNQ